MTNVHSALSISLAHSGGRIDVVTLSDNETVTIEEIAQFPLNTVTAQNTIFWDVLHSFSGLMSGIEQFYQDVTDGNFPLPDTVGLTGFHGSFALLDQRGTLLGLPVRYHSESLAQPLYMGQSVPKKFADKMSGLESTAPSVFEQLARLASLNDPRLEIGKVLLSVPDLYVYWLTGNAAVEATAGGTMFAIDRSKNAWALEMLDKLDIPSDIFPSIIQNGTLLGRFNGSKVIASATNRLASAIVAASAQHDDYAYLLVEDRSYAGTEVEEPIFKKAVARGGLTNHIGAFDSSLLTYETAGLLLLKRYRDAISHEDDYTIDDLVSLVDEAEPFRTLIDPNASTLNYAGDMPGLIVNAAYQANQPVPETHGEFVRTILESLALSYAVALDSVSNVSGKELAEVHLLGEGAMIPTLGQMTSNASNRTVVAGPVDAVAYGNAAVQLQAIGAETVSNFKQRIANSALVGTYQPQDQDSWQEAYTRFTQLYNN